MDTNRISRGEMIAAVSGIALFLIMFIFSWFGIDASAGAFSASAGANAWESFGFIDIILFFTVVVAVVGAALTANATDVNSPVAISAITAGLGILSVVLILFRIISPPDFGVGDLGDLGGIDVGGAPSRGGVKVTWLADRKATVRDSARERKARAR